MNKVSSGPKTTQKKMRSSLSKNRAEQMQLGGNHTTNRKLKKLLSSKLAQNTMRVSNGSSGRPTGSKKKDKIRISTDDKLKARAEANGSTSQMSEATQASQQNRRGVMTNQSHLTHKKKGCSTNRSSLLTTAHRNTGPIENSPSSSLMQPRDKIGLATQAASLNHTILPTSANSIKHFKRQFDKRQSLDFQFNKSSFTAQKTNSGQGNIETFNSKLYHGKQLDLIDKDEAESHIMGLTHVTERTKKPKKIFIGGLNPDTIDLDQAVTPRNMKTQETDLVAKQYNKTPRQFDFQDR